MFFGARLHQYLLASLLLSFLFDLVLDLGELLRYLSDARFSRRRSFPNVAHLALERLGAVAKRGERAVPLAVVCRGTL